MWKIYKITNKTYNEKEKCYKSYIGMTIQTIEKRFKEHCYDDTLTIFHAAIVAYGKDNWTLEILEDNIKTEKEALEREEFYILEHNTLVKNKKGYNVLQRSGGREIIDGKLKCYKCCEFKTLENFWKDKVQKCGYNAKCIECVRKYKRENKEYLDINKKNYRIKYKERQSQLDSEKSKRNIEKNSLLSIEELRKITPIKYCSSCKITHETTEFTKDKHKDDGLKTYCKQCCYEKDDINRSFKRSKMED